MIGANDITLEIRALFQRRGSSLYGGEAVTQLEHALQAAALAEAENTDPALVVAALLHDVGHLLHDHPNDAPSHGVDDIHEQLAYDWLSNYFGPDVTEAVRLHVHAKRYLCAVDPNYEQSLSPASRHSLMLQGGRLQDEEAQSFELHPYFAEGIRLRRWDDLAKVPGLETPNLDHFLMYVEQARMTRPSVEVAP
jgi:[1-hydroxy-2-(trimethylamino)ethyl]phosphonate dioxygenase